MPFDFRASFLRKVTSSTSLEVTLSKAVFILADWGIPHYVCGGFAVQEHGYPRFTADVDIIVPDPAQAIWRLRQSGLFRRNQGSKMTVTDKETLVTVDVLEGGSTLSKVGIISLPLPTRVSSTPSFLTLEDLISAKLSAGRQKDLADVVELIKANKLPEDHSVDPAMTDRYREMWAVAMEEEKNRRE